MIVADRTSDILRAACKVICERGSDRLRMSDVAAEAGVSSALVHYYFETRADLLARAFRFADTRVDAYVLERLESCSTPLERLETVLATYLSDDEAVKESFIVWAEMLRHAIYDESLRPTVADSYRGWIDQVGAHLETLGVVAPEPAATRLCALVDGLGEQMLVRDLGFEQARDLVRAAIDHELAVAR